MRIGELSRRSGVPVPTIKYYLREALLEPGETTAPNQADYGEAHLRRLRLVRALIDVGGVSVAAARLVIAALAAPDLAPHDLLGVAHHAVTPTRRPDRGTEEWRAARAEAARIAAGRGWLVEPEAVALDLLADVLAALTALGAMDIIGSLDHYVEAAEQLAGIEVDAVVARGDPTRMVELVVVGTVLGEALFSALRLLAQEHASAVRLGLGTAAGPGGVVSRSVDKPTT